MANHAALIHDLVYNIGTVEQVIFFSNSGWAFGEGVDLRELSVTLERIVTDDVVLLEACNQTRIQ